jgi:hypothetical protein
VLQDAPPPGGFPAIRIERRLPSTGPTGVTIFAVGLAVSAYGYYKVRRRTGWQTMKQRLMRWRQAVGRGAQRPRGGSAAARARRGVQHALAPRAACRASRALTYPPTSLWPSPPPDLQHDPAAEVSGLAARRGLGLAAASRFGDTARALIRAAAVASALAAPPSRCPPTHAASPAPSPGPSLPPPRADALELELTRAPLVPVLQAEEDIRWAAGAGGGGAAGGLAGAGRAVGVGAAGAGSQRLGMPKLLPDAPPPFPSPWQVGGLP